MKGEDYIEPQINVFEQAKQVENGVDYVTLTIGGNDVGFAKIVAKAVFHVIPNVVPAMLNNTWDNFYKTGGHREDIKKTYKKIAEEAGNQATIIVAGYPKLVNENGCGGWITKENAQSIDSSVTRFNMELNRIVEECKDELLNIEFVPVEKEFEGFEAYTEPDNDIKKEKINRIIVKSKEEDLGIDIKSEYSIHPNENGIRTYKECVQNKIDELEKEKSIDSISGNNSDISDMPLADESELIADPIGYGGLVLCPEDVVKKYYNALFDADIRTAVECLNPTTEKELRMISKVTGAALDVFLGSVTSIDKSVFDVSGLPILEMSGISEINIIECYSDNIIIDTNSDIMNYCGEKNNKIGDLIGKEADVYLKTRFKYNEEYHVIKEKFHVKNYGLKHGWRIEEEGYELLQNS